MIDQAAWRNPLRWYLFVLLLGIVLTLGVGDPIVKFQAQRLVQLTCALGLLAWCYRPQPRGFFSQPLINGWYGLGWVGFALIGLVVGFAGSMPFLSLGFLGFGLLQFALLPLLRPAWERHFADGVRLLALFGCVVLGIDVGIWMIDRIGELTPYAWFVGPRFGGDAIGFPYLIQNSRWANQLTVLLVWSFVPLMQQIQSGVIVHQKRFWCAICGALPFLAMTQIILNRGDGAFLALALGVLALGWVGWRVDGEARRLFWRSAALMCLAGVSAFLLSIALDGGQFFGGILTRNVREIAAPVEGDRLVLWSSFFRNSVASGFRGVGLPLFPLELRHCITPHNLALGLLYWLGLPGLCLGALLCIVFVPARFDWRGQRAFALPVLVSLFFYQLIDDIWLRPLSLSLILVVLSALKSPAWQPAGPQRSSLVDRFAFPGSTYRLLALLSVLMIVLSVASANGMAFLRLGMSVQRGACLIFF